MQAECGGVNNIEEKLRGSGTWVKYQALSSKCERKHGWELK